MFVFVWLVSGKNTGKLKGHLGESMDVSAFDESKMYGVIGWQILLN